MARILHPEFRDEQDDSMYPFEDTATLATEISDAQIFSDTFIDAAIYPIGGLVGAKLTRIVIGTGRIATLYVGDDEDAERASGTVDFLTPGDTIVLQDSYERPAGMLLSDANRLSIFQSWAPGDYQFSGATFVASVVTPLPAVGVRGFLTVDEDTGDIRLFHGDTWIVGENGAVVRKEAGTIRVDFVGDPLFRRRLCIKNDGTSFFTTPNFLKTINGYGPNDVGNFNLSAGEHAALDTVLRIAPLENGIKITAIGKTLETARVTRA